jgi:O-antigen/teichoic acid export membrane protein
MPITELSSSRGHGLGLIFRNISFLGLSRILTLGTGVITLPLIARYLHPDQFGQYAVVLAFASFFSLLLRGNLDLLLFKEMAATGNIRSVFQSGLALQLFLSVGAYGCLVAGVLIMSPGFAMVRGVMVAGLANFFIYLHTIPTVVFRAQERTQYEALLTAVERISYFALVLACIHWHWGLDGLYWALLSSQALRAVLSFLFLKEVLSDFRVDLSLCRRLVRSSLPLFVTAGLFAVAWRSELFLLKYFQGNAAVGIFAGPFKILDLSRVISESLLIAFLPSLASRAAAGEWISLSSIARYGARLLMAAGILGAGISGLFPAEVRHLLLGSGYTASDVVFRLLAVCFPLMFLSHWCAGLMIALGRFDLLVLDQAASTALRVLIGWWLIPRLDVQGAALAVGVGELSFLVLGYYLVRRASKHAGRSMISFPTLLAGILLMGLGYFLLPMPFWQRALVMGLLYLLSLVALGIFSRRGTQSIRRALIDSPPQAFPTEEL